MARIGKPQRTLDVPAPAPVETPAETPAPAPSEPVPA